MAELRDCPHVAVFSTIRLRDVCAKCAENEEKMYEEVYRFLRRRENRAATIERIVEVTGVTETLTSPMGAKRTTPTCIIPESRLSVRQLWQADEHRETMC